MANQIYGAYQTHILPIVSEESLFAKSLVQVAHYFGSPEFSPEIPLEMSLKMNGLEEWGKLHHEEIKTFVQEASRPLYHLQKKEKEEFPVVIISTSCSGGNQSVALSIANWLQSKPNVRVVVIDAEEVAKEHDPMMLATGTYTYDMIYSHILQKNNDLSVIKDRKKLYREMINYIPNNYLCALKLKVLSHQPDLIISTRSYTCDDLSLATLGVPFRLCHADFELCPSLCSYYRSIPSKNIRFWVPILKPGMFKPLFEHMDLLHLYNEEDDVATLFAKLGSQNLSESFELAGYPCANFYEIDDKQALRKKWGIHSQEIPIFIVMGKHSTQALQHIFYELKGAKTHPSLKYIFICGENEALKEELQKSAPDTMQILGLLTPAEMNEVMNLSKLGISKAGGATVSEALSTRTSLLMLGFYPWEEVNAIHLVKSGLGTIMNPQVPLIEQIETAIQADPIHLPPEKDWRECLDQLFNGNPTAL